MGVLRCGLCFFPLHAGASKIDPAEAYPFYAVVQDASKRSAFENFDTSLECHEIDPETREATSLASLEASSKRGCLVCAFLMREIRDRHFPRVHNNVRTLCVLRWTPSLDRLIVRFLGPEYVFDFYYDQTSSNVLNLIDGRFGLGRNDNWPTGNTGSSQCIQKLNDWLNICIESHEECSSGETHLPNRVIHIDSQVNPPRIRLVDSHKMTGKYTCLSYCWGAHRPGCITTADSLSKNMEEIVWGSLPRTMQDAILVTVHVRVEYIWIDSICIIQDDLDDWTREAAEMANIYSNSYLTIVATRAADSTKGMFSEMPSLYKGVEVPSIGLEAQLLCRLRPPHPEPRDQYALPNDSTNFPLLFRGWCFQERNLSKRLVHFLSTEIYWECTKKTWCECGTDRGGLLMFQKSLNLISARVYWWFFIVSKYTALALTQRKDKLPALAGSAKMFASTNPSLGRYIAGLWQKTLATDLLWYRVSDENVTRLVPKKRPNPWRAPTWSWASIDGRVTSEWIQDRELPSPFEILDVHSENIGPDEYGMLSSAYIMLSANLMGAKIHYKVKRLSNGEEDIVDCCITHEGEKIGHLVMEDYLLSNAGDDFVADGQDIFCLEAKIGDSQASLREKDESDSWRRVFLILVSSGEAAYKRIGWLEVRDVRTLSANLAWERKTFKFL